MQPWIIAANVPYSVALGKSDLSVISAFLRPRVDSRTVLDREAGTPRYKRSEEGTKACREIWCIIIVQNQRR